jgi:uncharacterized caspase-like protein
VTPYQAKYKSSWALVIGINCYQYTSPLSYACNDADAVVEVLVQELDFPFAHVTLLKDGEATKQAILKTFLDFKDKAAHQDDRVFVFYAGHGTTMQSLRGDVGYLVPVDGCPDDLSSLIRWDDLTRNADLIAAKHILFIMDACYSGLATQRAIPPGTQRFLSDMLQRLSRQVLTAGKADQTVADGGGPKGQNSIFTGCLLEGLRGAAANPNGVLTANGLMFYIYQNISQNSRSRQTPHYGHLDGDGDFILQTPNKEHLEANSTSDYLVETVVEMPELEVASTVITIQPTFAERNGYSDPTRPSFGRNDWSNKLGEARYSEGYLYETTKAFSWLSLVIEPIANQAITVNIAEESVRLPKLNLYSGEPYERFKLPHKVTTTINSVILTDGSRRNVDEFLGHYLRFEKNGNIEYADNRYVFVEHRGIRCFYYVQIIGTIWQFVFLANKILSSVGYKSGVRFSVNLIGTFDSVLVDFSKEPGEGGQHWVNLFDGGSRSHGLLDLKCSDPNLRMDYQFAIGSLGENEIQKIIKDIAQKLGLAYNHQSLPRCFNYGTEIFPWNQFLQTKNSF